MKWKPFNIYLSMLVSFIMVCKNYLVHLYCFKVQSSIFSQKLYDKHYKYMGSHKDYYDKLMGKMLIGRAVIYEITLLVFFIVWYSDFHPLPHYFPL